MPNSDTPYSPYTKRCSICGHKLSLHTPDGCQCIINSQATVCLCRHVPSEFELGYSHGKSDRLLRIDPLVIALTSPLLEYSIGYRKGYYAK